MQRDAENVRDWSFCVSYTVFMPPRQPELNDTSDELQAIVRFDDLISAEEAKIQLLQDAKRAGADPSLTDQLISICETRRGVMVRCDEVAQRAEAALAKARTR